VPALSIGLGFNHKSERDRWKKPDEHVRRGLRFPQLSYHRDVTERTSYMRGRIKLLTLIQMSRRASRGNLRGIHSPAHMGSTNSSNASWTVVPPPSSVYAARFKTSLAGWGRGESKTRLDQVFGQINGNLSGNATFGPGPKVSKGFLVDPGGVMAFSLGNPLPRFAGIVRI